MAKKKADDFDGGESSEATMTVEITKKIDDLIYQKKMIARDQEAFKEALGAIAENLGVKPGVLSKRVDLIIKEEEKGGEVLSRTNDLDFVDKYFSIKGYSVEDKELN